MKVGVIGCGMVSHAYCGTIARDPSLELVALASRTTTSAEAQASRYGGRATSVDALLADPTIDLVVVLAPPQLHHPLGRRVLAAGKHLYLEKPLATSLADAADLLALAEARGLQVGCAPDTFLGDGHAAARQLIDAGAIGRVVGGAASFGPPGMEGWHPAPSAFFAAGGGHLLDIGPYYVTQLVDLLGPVGSVVASGATPRTQREAPGGRAIPVSVPTSVAGALCFDNGALVSLALSWDVVAHCRPPLELYGERGTLIAPDPNGFDGLTRVTEDGERWETTGAASPRRRPDKVALAKGVAALMAGVDPLTGQPVTPETSLRLGDRRGLGVVELATAVRAGREPRAGGRLAYHVLEVLLGLQESIGTGRRIEIRSRPAPRAPGTTGHNRNVEQTS